MRSVNSAKLFVDPEMSTAGSRYVTPHSGDIRRAPVQPYNCVFVDSNVRDFSRSVLNALSPLSDRHRDQICARMRQLWTTEQNPAHVLPVLSVRSGLDLYLTARDWPHGSEVIMSAINIPSMAAVVHAHGLRVVSLDVEIETLAPKHHLLDGLVSERTVALLVAHVYGRWYDMRPLVEAARRHRLALIEDCAEGFHGMRHLGEPRADISLFSFGVIKHSTALGGGVAKVRDQAVHRCMAELQQHHPRQSRAAYVRRLARYFLLYMPLNWAWLQRVIIETARAIGWNHQAWAVSMLRGFNTSGEAMLRELRLQPSTALLAHLLHVTERHDPRDAELTRTKGEYVSQRLSARATLLGTKALIQHFWLFPILVENPDMVLKNLNLLGVDAYRGATQLSLIESDGNTVTTPTSNKDDLNTFVSRYPHEAKYIMDHVIYLPVNKLVPFYVLDRICDIVNVVVENSGDDVNKNLRKLSVKMQSKL